MSPSKTFDTPKELARHLYDEAVEPGDTVEERARIAALASRFSIQKFVEYSEDDST